MQMHRIRLIFLENDLIEPSCLMYLANRLGKVQGSVSLAFFSTCGMKENKKKQDAENEVALSGTGCGINHVAVLTMLHVQ